MEDRPAVASSTRIRAASAPDSDAIRGLHLCAFPDGENRLVAALAASLLEARTGPETLSLVAEDAGAIVGHVAFSPVWSADAPGWTGYLLAPLGVLPGHQKSGIGRGLVEHGIALLDRRGINRVFVYGDPAYYGRFGFSADAATRFIPPCPLTHPFGWQARVLHPEPDERTFRLACVPALQDPALW